MEVMTIHKLYSFVLLFFLVLPASGLSRSDSVLQFVDSTRLSDSGFANTPEDVIDIEATRKALEIKSLLFDEVNNSLDILYFIQRLQDNSGGFAPFEGSTPSLEATINAVKSFNYIQLNQTQFTNWQIYPYFNETIIPRLVSVTNGSIDLLPLNTERLILWQEYLTISNQLGILPGFPFFELVDRTKELQYANGSYYSVEIAIESINLLNILGDIPNDYDLAAKFILSFIVSNGAFSLDNTIPSLSITYRALNALMKLINLYTLETRTDITRFVFNQQVARSGFKEIGDTTVTIEATYYAILILSLLDELDELQAPDVLQEVGFIAFPWIAILVPFTIPILFKIRRKFHE